MAEELEEELKHDVNDIAEDHREEGESIADLQAGDDSQEVKDDIAEDHREEGESIEALKTRIGELEQMVNDLSAKLEEAHKQWVNGEANEYKETKRDYESIKEDLQ